MIQEKYDPVLGQDIVIETIDIPKEQESSVIPIRTLIKGVASQPLQKLFLTQKKYLKQKKG